jgi:hypothetical protein
VKNREREYFMPKTEKKGGSALMVCVGFAAGRLNAQVPVHPH